MIPPPEIRILSEKKLTGLNMPMTLATNKTGELWRSFMPRRKEIKNVVGSDLYSMQIYDEFYFNNFDPALPFVKWATLEVNSFDELPAGMDAYILPGGLYAVFLYKGDATKAAETFSYIFGVWLPGSKYMLDHRPHFELLGEKYKNGDPDSEEEIWIPVKLKHG